MDTYYATGLCLFVIGVFAFLFAFTKMRDNTEIESPISFSGKAEMYKMLPPPDETTKSESPISFSGKAEDDYFSPPLDMSAVVNGVAIMSFIFDGGHQLTGIKILSQDTGYYSEDGITYYLCIDGVRVEGAEINVKDLRQWTP